MVVTVVVIVVVVLIGEPSYLRVLGSTREGGDE